MSVDHFDGALVRQLVASCDFKDAAHIPKALFSYISSVLSSREPNVYLVDLLPSLSSAVQAFITGIGAFNRSPLPELEVARRRGRLLECLDAFMDEARLGEQSVAFMEAIRAVDRN